MRTPTLISITALLLVLCSCSPKIVTKTITHRYYNISFVPDQINKTGQNSLDITIMPIDASSINKETFEAARFDGNYEKELATSIERQRMELDGLSRSQRAIIIGKLNAIDEVAGLEESGLIPPSTAYLLKSRIWYGDINGNDGSEISSLSTIDSNSDAFNPYKINQNYLSVFRVTFVNNGTEIQRIRIDNFQILSGEQLLFPLANDYFEENHRGEPEKIQNIYRMNMPNELVITPNQRITKYIAIPAINPRNKELQIQLVQENNVSTFNFNIEENPAFREYNLDKFWLSANTRRVGEKRFYYAIWFDNGITFATKGSEVFISREQQNNLSNICVIAIDSFDSKASSALKRNFRFGNQSNNRVSVQIPNR